MVYRAMSAVKQWQQAVGKLQTFLAAALTMAMTGGCMVGPKYHRPAVQTPANFRDLSEKAQVAAQATS